VSVYSSSTLKRTSASEDDGGIGGVDGEKLMRHGGRSALMLRSVFIFELNGGIMSDAYRVAFEACFES